MSDATRRLEWGYNAGLPAEADTAWGCRAILYAGGYLDFVWDRQSAIGPEAARKRLEERLNGEGGIMDRVKAQVRRLYLDGDISPSEADEVTILRDASPSGVVVKANTMGSHGYLYIVVYFKRPQAKKQEA